MAYRLQCKKCGADIHVMVGWEAKVKGEIREHNCGCMNGLVCGCDWQKYDDNYKYSYDSINRRWVVCPICKKKRPAWGEGKPYPCKCGFRF